MANAKRRLLAALLALLVAASFLAWTGCGGGGASGPSGKAGAKEEGAAEETAGEAGAPGDAGGGAAASGAGKALLVVAPRDFNDHEYEATRSALEGAGHGVAVASSRRGKARGAQGTEVEVYLELARAKAGDYVAVVFIGGEGAEVLFDDRDALRLAREAEEAGITVAAICIAPAILARAGVLKEKKATCYPSVTGELEAGGAEFVQEEVVVDGKVVTACGPEAAEAFGAAVAGNI